MGALDPAVAWSVVAVLGLCVGSFLNVLISRLPDPDRSLLDPIRSECPRCGYSIPAHDNVPVLSWLWLGGRCRQCGGSIGFVYPAVELTTMLLFLWGFHAHGLTLAGAELTLFGVLLLAVAVTDAQTYLIPDVYTIGGALAGIAFAGLAAGPGAAVVVALDGLAAGALLAVFGWGVGRVVGREALGFGDVLLVAMMATFLGFGGAMIALWLAALSGALFGVLHSRRHAEGHIPFGLHLAVGGAAMAALEHGPLALDYITLIHSFLPWH